MRDVLTRAWSLKPFDAIHLATAKWLAELAGETIEFHTYSKDLPSYEVITGYTICEPYLVQGRLI